ncbi:MAG: DUF4384 domain-containing protein [Sphingobacteriales bacterium]|nr:MAG: DUF4384 domain-containing protein [Sphingobacteriales bacterium]
MNRKLLALGFFGCLAILLYLTYINEGFLNPKKEDKQPTPIDSSRNIIPPQPDNRATLAGEITLISSDRTNLSISNGLVRNIYVDDYKPTRKDEKNIPKPKPVPKPNPSPKPAPANPFEPDSSDKTMYFEYEIDKSLKSGDQFRTLFKNGQPCYVYAFSIDLTQKTVVCYPYGNNNANFDKNGSQAIPADTTQFFTLDKTKGTDYFCWLYATKELDINAIAKAMETQKGTVFQRLYKILQNDIVPVTDIEYAANRIGFKTKKTNKAIVPIVIQINHE